MKIILTQEVSGLGAPGDIVEVRDGYGRNYLLPQGFAIAWTKGAEKQVAVIQRARSAREIRDLGHANEVKAQLAGLDVRLAARAGDGGRLFGSVTPAEIVNAVKSAGGPVLDRRRLELPGSHQVPRFLPGQRQAAPGGHREVQPERRTGQVATRPKGRTRQGCGPSAFAGGVLPGVAGCRWRMLRGVLRPAGHR